MGLQDSGSILTISVMGVPWYSARGASQTLTLISESQDQRRSINGVLLNLSYPQFRKYSTKITCKDQRSPAMDGIFPGQEVTIGCICELAYPVGGSPARPVVSGSQRVEHGHVFYRPILDMLIQAVDPFVSIDEWAADIQWEIDAVEK